MIHRNFSTENILLEILIEVRCAYCIGLRLMDNFVFKTQPLKHQLEALKQSIDKPAFALLLEMGTGKTKVTIDTL